MSLIEEIARFVFRLSLVLFAVSSLIAFGMTIDWNSHHNDEPQTKAHDETDDHSTRH